MTRGRIRICPCRVTDLSRECCKIMIVVAADIGIEPAQPESLEQMSLPQIADIVIDSRSLGPMAHGPKVARKDDQAKGTAKHLEYATVFGSHLQPTHSHYSWTQEIVLQPHSGSNRISKGLSSVPAAQSRWPGRCTS